MNRVMRRAWVQAAVAALGFAAPLASQRSNPNPMDSIRRLPGYRGALDTTVYLAPARIAKYAGSPRREPTRNVRDRLVTLLSVSSPLPRPKRRRIHTLGS